MEWEKQSNETTRSYEWFCKYRDYGTDRSMTKILRKYNKPLKYRWQLNKWSGMYAWGARCAAYDEYIESTVRAEKEDVIIQTAREHAAYADKIMERLLAKLAVLSVEDISTSNFIAMSDLAVKIKREALGMASKHEVNQVVTLEDELSAELLRRSRALLNRDDETKDDG